MPIYFPRIIEKSVREALQNNPVVAITGPRQCGKSTLAKQISGQQKNWVYLDLERPSDLQKLENAEWFLSTQRGKLICMDEIQRKPELFPLIRSLVDEWDYPGAFLILGSASRELLMQSSESLAGRISYQRLTPFLRDEIEGHFSLEQSLARGGFPRSLLAKNNESSFQWRNDFISTFLERDILFWKNVAPATMRRLWQMLAHVNGQTADYTNLSRSLGVTSVTIKNYIDFLESTYMVEVVQPYHSNFGKRLVKSPKIYIADSGIAAALLGLNGFDAISGHPALGTLWEQTVLSNLKGAFPDCSFYYYRSSHGAEIDFVMETHHSVFAIECKSTLSPALSKGNHNALADIQPTHTFIVCPTSKGWPMSNGVDVVSIAEVIASITASPTSR